MVMAAPESGSTVEKSKKLDWSFTPKEGLPNVLVLGDSISIAYTLPVREQLKDVANIYRPVKVYRKKEFKHNPKVKVVNCQGTANGVKNIDQWIGDEKWDVIHFNFGLHDLKHFVNGQNSNLETDPQQASPEEYRENLIKIVNKLQTTGAKLIFATTTPIAPGTTDPLRKPEYPPAYNEIALEIMNDNDIQVNDLFSFCEPQLTEIQKSKNCHFNPEGSEMIAREVSKVIREALPK